MFIISDAFKLEMNELTVHLYVIRFQVAMSESEHLTRLILLFHVQIKYMLLKGNNSQSIYSSTWQPEKELCEIDFRFTCANTIRCQLISYQ